MTKNNKTITFEKAKGRIASTNKQPQKIRLKLITHMEQGTVGHDSKQYKERQNKYAIK